MSEPKPLTESEEANMRTVTSKPANEQQSQQIKEAVKAGVLRKEDAIFARFRLGSKKTKTKGKDIRPDEY